MFRTILELSALTAMLRGLFVDETWAIGEDARQLASTPEDNELVAMAKAFFAGYFVAAGAAEYFGFIALGRDAKKGVNWVIDKCSSDTTKQVPVRETEHPFRPEVVPPIYSD